MIHALTPNPAFDVTYHVDRLAPGEVHRVGDRAERAGGKGLNVAAVVRQRGGDVTCWGLLGNDGGARFLELARHDLPGAEHDWEPTPGRVRTSVAVVTGDRSATVLNESGDPVPAASWRALVARAGRLTARDVLAVSGSLPPGIDRSALHDLVAAATATGARVVVDTSSAALLPALAAGPTLVKPNREELAALTGLDDPTAGARALLDLGAHAVACSLGADGALLVTPDGTWTERPARHIRGNPTGAGDASVAAWCLALADGVPLHEALADVVACGAAACATPTAGAIDLGVFDELRRLRKEDHDHR